MVYNVRWGVREQVDEPPPIERRIMDELEREAFESKIREAVVARMAELQFGSKGQPQRSMGAVSPKIDGLNITEKIQRSKKSLDRASDLVGQLVEALADASNDLVR